MSEPLQQPADWSPALALRRLIFGHRVTELIKVAVQLDLADHLADAALSAAELAPRIPADAFALKRLLRALACVGVVEASADERFALTPLGACLRSDAPFSQRAWVRMESADFYQHAWRDLVSAVQTGTPAVTRALGSPIYTYLAAHADMGQLFQEAMRDATQLVVAAVAASYNFALCRRVVDVGGGYGTLLVAILQAYPHLEGVLFDRAEVVAEARAHVEAAGMVDRCQLVGGDFFASLPAGGDCYLLSRVLMDHDDARSQQILRQCYQAMNEGGRVLIIQQIVPNNPSDEACFDAVMSDLNMLVFLPGRERTLSEYRSLLEAAGFAMANVIPTQGLMSIIEGTRVELP